MRLAKVLALVLCITCFASLAMAQPEPADLGVFTDLAGTLTTGDPVAFVQFNFYVIAFDSPGDYKGYEFEIGVPAAITVLGRVLNPVTALNVGNGDNFIVGTGGCIPAAGPTALVSYTGLVFAPLLNEIVCIGPSTPSSFSPPVPGYLDCANNLIPFGVAENGQSFYPDGCAVFGATDDPPIATENASWGSVKTRF